MAINNYKDPRNCWKANQLRDRKFVIDSLLWALKTGMIEIEKQISKEKKDNLLFAISFIAILYSLTGITALMR